MVGGTTSKQPPARVETPAGTTTRSGEEAAKTGSTRTEPAPVNYEEKAKAELKWIEDIQKEVKKVEELQKTLGAANVKDKLGPMKEALLKRLAVRKENFKKYRSLVDKNENSEK
ncbi:unnamed protein product [Calypogeia fissa]